MNLQTQFIYSRYISPDLPYSLSFKYVFLLFVVLNIVHPDMFSKDIMRMDVKSDEVKHDVKSDEVNDNVKSDCRCLCTIYK